MTQQSSKRQMMRDKRAKDAMRGRLTSVALMIAGAAFLFFMILWPIVKPAGDFKTITPRDLPEVADNSMGAADAPITITEYSDFQCPYCRKFMEDTEEMLVETYVKTGQVRFVYRSFGIFIGPESGQAAEAAYCAGDQGKFWDMHDIIFTNQTGENVGAYTNKRLEAFAGSIGLDMGAYNSCMSSNKYTDRVNQDGEDGLAAGLQATPSFVLSYVVNGETKTKVIQGAESFGTFQAEIEAALAEIAAAQ